MPSRSPLPTDDANPPFPLSLKGTVPAQRSTLRARFGFFAASALSLLAACGSRSAPSGSNAAEPIPECDAFVAAYAHCLGTLGPERIAQARAEQTRSGLVVQTQAAHGDAARAELRKQCEANLSQLTATCQ